MVLSNLRTAAETSSYAVEKAGLPGSNEGQVVEYELVANRGKTSAENLKVSR
jgi:cold shock CspA family protein